MNRMREPLFRASTEHENWDQKQRSKRINKNIRIGQTVEEKMADLTELFG